jgi:hypothetical protein
VPGEKDVAKRGLTPTGPLQKGGQRRVLQHLRLQKNLARRAHAGAIPTADRVGKIASKREACGNACSGRFCPPYEPPRGKLQRGGTPCGNNLSCCCPVRLGGAAGLAGAGAADASAAGAASAGAVVATTGFLQSVSQTS